MSLRIANREFAPRAWTLLLTAAAMAAFITLGSWQLQRGREKLALVEAFQQGQQSSVELVAGVAFDDLPRYQHVRVTGSYEPGRQVLLDNMPSQAGKPGYRVLTPLRRTGSERLLLVDRGWVPLGSSRASLPDVTVAADPRSVGVGSMHCRRPGFVSARPARLAIRTGPAC